MLTLHTVPSPVALPTSQRCVNVQGFSLQAQVRLAINPAPPTETPRPLHQPPLPTNGCDILQPFGGKTVSRVTRHTTLEEAPVV